MGFQRHNGDNIDSGEGKGLEAVWPSDVQKNKLGLKRLAKEYCNVLLRGNQKWFKNTAHVVTLHSHGKQAIDNTSVFSIEEVVVSSIHHSEYARSKRSSGSHSSTPRFSNSHSPSSSSLAFASSTSSFSRFTSFFHRASSPTRVNLSAPSVRFSLDRSVSPNRSIAVAPRQANAHHHKRTTLEPRFGCHLRFRPPRTAATSNLTNWLEI
ncbi:hypothetical protein Fmac_026438 [Flemingia macrophylla]|uniref:Uncharacterized protein n=1 Tax=Flemingia macrophylla TaxID=520843 RepID=A0ABD1LEW7_9FABA